MKKEYITVEKPMSRKEKLEIIKQILKRAKEITDAGYGNVRFAEGRD